MRDDFRIRFGDELVAFALELLFQLEIILDDPVVNNHDLAGAVAVGVRIFFRGAAVRGPASVSDTIRALDRRLLNDFFEVAEFPRSAPDFQLSVLGHDGNARGVVAAILELSQAFYDDWHYFLRADIADNPAHERRLLRILLGKTNMDLRSVSVFMIKMWRMVSKPGSSAGKHAAACKEIITSVKWSLSATPVAQAETCQAMPRARVRRPLRARDVYSTISKRDSSITGLVSTSFVMRSSCFTASSWVKPSTFRTKNFPCRTSFTDSKPSPDSAC